MHKDEFIQEGLQYMDALYHFAMRLSGSADTAGDLVQETYLKAMCHQDQFREGSNLKAWLFTILKNIHLNRAERAKREESLDEGPESRPSGNVISHRFAKPGEQLRWITREDLETALSELPGVFRDALVLSDFEGFSYREIAQILDIPQGTVMSRISRARQAMRERLSVYKSVRSVAKKGFTTDSTNFTK